MDNLRITTVQAPNREHVVAALCEYLSDHLEHRVELATDVPWEERPRLLDAGDIDLGWICGLPYVRRTDAGTAAFELLATPVGLAPRYGGLPVYFSDVIVRRDGPFGSLDDLRGGIFAYNEP